MKWRNWAAFTGWFPNAVRALDHYLDRTGTFVPIPQDKVDSVRRLAEADHLSKARTAFRRAAILEAGAAWVSAGAFPASGGLLKPQSIEFTLTWMSGKSTPGLTDDNLTYYGSSIMSEVRFRATQGSIPANPDDEEVLFEIEVIEWKSWVVDNYDWEGDKAFGIFARVGLPTQKEMNSLQSSGLAKSYQRSSKSWIVDKHGLSPWTETVYALTTLRDVGKQRIRARQQAESDRKRQEKEGALPVPRPAEEMIRRDRGPSR